MVMMLFVIDVGNTNTVLGVFREGTLQHEWRIKTDRYKTEDEFAVLIQSLFKLEQLTFPSIQSILISSVVPPIMESLEKLCQKYFQVEPLIIGHKMIESCLQIKYPRPEELGADRIVNAVGAIEKYNAPLIIIDFGTATTYCYIDEEKAYQGGLISPGINISLDALYRNAAKLPKIEVEQPKTIVGQTTVKAMQSGVYYGYVGQVDGIVKRILEEQSVDAKVIATGGLAGLIANGSETIDYVEPHLTLFGLEAIYRKTQRES